MPNVPGIPKSKKKETLRTCTNEDVLASVRRFSFCFSSHKQATARKGLTTRRIVVYPLRELERQEVLDGVEERRRRDEELPFGQETRRLGKDCGITVKGPSSRKNARTYNSRETW